jgi:hypothetical protein
MSLEISLIDSATPALEKLAVAFDNSEAMNQAIAEAALPTFQRHFLQKADTNRNKFGARGTFWNRMISSTRATASDHAAIIRMPAELRLRSQGGTVYPKNAQNLAIPNHPDAYGKSPRDFNDLRFIPYASGAKALVRRAQTKIRVGKKGIERGPEVGGEVFYWLTPSATINPDPTILPPLDSIQAAARQGLSDYVNLINSRRQRN